MSSTALTGGFHRGFSCADYASRTYPEVTFAMCHDSHAQEFLTDSVLLDVANKTNSFQQQLEDGIRSFRINSALVDKEIRLCHGAAILETAVKLLPGSFKVRTVFCSLVEFGTVENPNEIVTVFDEGSAEPAHVDRDLRRAFDRSLESLMYIRRSESEPWPRIRDLIAEKRQLVYFTKKYTDFSSIHPHLLPMWHPSTVFQSPWCVYDVATMRQCVLPEDIGAHGVRGRGDWKKAALYLYNHMFYTDGFPHLSSAVRGIIAKFSKEFDTGDSSKTQQALGPCLNFDVVHAWKVSGKRPNFINVDFYQGLGGNKSNIFSLTAAMNRTELLGSALAISTDANHITAYTDARLKFALSVITCASGKLMYSQSGDGSKWREVHGSADIHSKSSLAWVPGGVLLCCIHGAGQLWYSNLQPSMTDDWRFGSLMRVDVDTKFAPECNPVAFFAAGTAYALCGSSTGAVCVVTDPSGPAPRVSVLYTPSEPGSLSCLSVCTVGHKVIVSALSQADHKPGSLVIIPAEPNAAGELVWGTPVCTEGNFGSVSVLETTNDLVYIFVRGSFDKLPYFAFYHTEQRVLSALRQLTVRDETGNGAVLTGDLQAMWDPQAVQPTLLLVGLITQETLTDVYVPDLCRAAYVSRSLNAQFTEWSTWKQLSPASTNGSLALIPELMMAHYIMQGAPFSSTLAQRDP